MKTLILILLMVLTLPVIAEENDPPAAQVVATYFHRNLRCQTCLQIEDMARYTIEMERAEALETGRLVWRAVNFEEESSSHFAEEYDLEGSTLILAIMENGKPREWAKLEGTWNLYEDTGKFDAYVLGVVDEYLEAASGSQADIEAE